MKFLAKNKGSFLIEALLAVFIIAVAVVALLRTCSMTVQVLNRYKKTQTVEALSERIFYDIQSRGKVGSSINGQTLNGGFAIAKYQVSQHELPHLQIRILDADKRDEMGVLHVIY